MVLINMDCQATSLIMDHVTIRSNLNYCHHTLSDGRLTAVVARRWELAGSHQSWDVWMCLAKRWTHT